MKKTKKLLIMSILAISTFILCGMTTVRAAAFSLTNTDIICDPSKLERGGRADCYIIGVPSETGDSVNGYIVKAYTTKFLKLKSASKIVPNTEAAWTDATSATATIAATDDMPESLKTFSCAYDSEGIKTGTQATSYGCGAFYTINTASANAFTSSTIKKTGIKSDLLPNATYGVIGYITVELDQSATGNECGEVCVKVWRVPEKENYSNYLTCGNDADNSNNCGSDSGNDYKCKEIHYNETPTGPIAETGAFASYALLAACALIAISAIALSKKNNRFNRI